MDIKKSFVPFVISGTHQHNYNHVALGSPTRTPKNGKIMRWGGKLFHSVEWRPLEPEITK